MSLYSHSDLVRKILDQHLSPAEAEELLRGLSDSEKVDLLLRVGEVARPATQGDGDHERDDDRRRDQEPDRREQRQPPPPATVAPIRDDDSLVGHLAASRGNSVI